MDLSFIGQPFPDAGQLGPALAGALGRYPGGKAWLATAWAKQSGLGRIASSIRDFRATGGRIEAVVGVDEGGATLEGLHLALDMFDRVLLFHDRGNRTFHPKLYLIQANSGREASVLVGSGNVTKGGLFTNYEAALLVRLDLESEVDSRVWNEAWGFYDALRSDDTSIQALDTDVLRAVEQDPAVRVGSERSANASRILRRALAPDAPSMFGPPTTGLASAPPAGAFAVPADEEDSDASGPALEHEIEADVGEALEAADPTEEPAHEVEPGFFKRLSKFDVSSTSAPGQIIIPIRYLPFFPELSVEKDETDDGGVRQSAAEFDVTFTQEGWVHPAHARVILYEPAEDHPRPNKELRFTFRSIAIRDALHERDVLVFRNIATGITVSWEPPGSRGGGRFGELAG